MGVSSLFTLGLCRVRFGGEGSTKDRPTAGFPGSRKGSPMFGQGGPSLARSLSLSPKVGGKTRRRRAGNEVGRIALYVLVRHYEGWESTMWLIQGSEA